MDGCLEWVSEGLSGQLSVKEFQKMSVSTVIDIEDTSVLEARSPCGSHHIKDGSRFFARVAEVKREKEPSTYSL